MITPKEKAEELVQKMKLATDEFGYININIERHKQCALIAIEEVFLAIGDDYFKKYEFYLEVKRQLEKL